MPNSQLATLPALALRQARLHLQEYGSCLPGEISGAINERLLRSWQRSLAAGLQTIDKVKPQAHTTGSELRQILECNQELLAYSLPVMEYLFASVKQSKSLVVLADNRGMLMHTLGDADFLNKAERVALASGASWHEEHRGTNAIGTALAESRDIEIHGAEHFLERNAFLTCAAAPIMSAKGSIVGILDISGEQRSGHPYTLSLVNNAVRMIENRLISANCKRHLRLHLHMHAEGIGTLAEAILLLSEDAQIIGANRVALNLLQLQTSDLGAVQLDTFIDTRLEALLAHRQARPAQPLQLHCHDGRALFAQLFQDPIALSSAMRGTPHAAAEPKCDALAALDSGDLRWRNAAEKTRRILAKPIPLLIQGESGVGKEFFAKAAHASGPRSSGPFVAINCAAIPENLIEAELFGYAPGAFTGARREGSLGRLREAHGGSLFLDEIGDMPLSMQSRLLRVLQERSVTPLGGGKAVDLDFALICATHCQLRQAAELGKFRYDLYYRINGLAIQLPPLRERSDFLELTARLLLSLAPDRTLNIEASLLAQLSAHDWPGNLRQYASVLRTACAMLDPHETDITWQHLADDIAQDLEQNQVRTPVTAHATDNMQLALQVSHNLKQLSRSAIALALETHKGNVSQAARSLGISRQTLYRKMTG